jgi:rRNA-processing protein FCF1
VADSTVYTFAGASVAVECRPPSVAKWLDEFLTPAFERRAGAGEPRVRVEQDGYEALVASRPCALSDVEACFALDTEVVHHPAWRLDGTTVMHDEKFECFYLIDESDVRVVTHRKSTRPRVGSMRVIRELATASALADTSRFQLHAAAVEVDGRAVLIAGSKGAGKTTLLAYLASSTGAAVVTNDRALLSRTARGYEVRGVPTIVSVRPNTAALLPHLFRDAVPAVPVPAHLTRAEWDAARARAGFFDVSTRLKLAPPQLARLLGVGLTARAPVAAVVFPEPAPRPAGPVVTPLSAVEGERRLSAARFGVSPGNSSPTVFEQMAGTRRPAGADTALLSELAAVVPCFRVGIYADTYRNAGGAVDLLSSVLAGSRA